MWNLEDKSWHASCASFCIALFHEFRCFGKCMSVMCAIGFYGSFSWLRQLHLQPKARSANQGCSGTWPFTRKTAVWIWESWELCIDICLWSPKCKVATLPRCHVALLDMNHFFKTSSFAALKLLGRDTNLVHLKNHRVKLKTLRVLRQASELWRGWLLLWSDGGQMVRLFDVFFTGINHQSTCALCHPSSLSEGLYTGCKDSRLKLGWPSHPPPQKKGVDWPLAPVKSLRLSEEWLHRVQRSQSRTPSPKRDSWGFQENPQLEWVQKDEKRTRNIQDASLHNRIFEFGWWQMSRPFFFLLSCG